MRLKNIRCIVHSDRNDRTACLGRDLKASLMEREHIRLIRPFVAGTLREDADGNAGLDLLDGGEDGLQSLLDVVPVQEQAVEIFHPVGEKGIALHLFLSNVPGADGAAGVGEQDVKIAPVVADVENRSVPGDVFLADDGHLRPGNPEDKAENRLDQPQGADLFRHGRKFPDDPLHDQNGNREDQKADDDGRY